MVVKSKLQSIEWGGDVHVPHGNTLKAQEVAKMTRDAGLAISAYGSYYRFDEEIPFASVLETAVALSAPLIRVWAGRLGSAAADEGYWQKMLAQSQRIADMAEKAGVTVAFEYHGGTLTDTRASALRLLSEINHPNLRSYWQPLFTHTLDERMQGLQEISPWLTNVHVYHWIERTKYPLEAGWDDWQQYFSELAKLPGEHYASLEFVRDNDPTQFFADAKTLNRLLLTQS